MSAVHPLALLLAAAPLCEMRYSQSPLLADELSWRIPDRTREPPIERARPMPPFADLLARASQRSGGLVVDGRRLTIDARLQQTLTDILRQYQTPYAAVVALEPATGRVLAMAEQSQARPDLRGLCTQAVFPAASIFKIVTAAALLDEGVSPQEVACYHGGKRRLSEKLLLDTEKDRRCIDLSAALAQSANVVFAKLTHRYLSSAKLADFAGRFGFNRPLPFAVPTDVSLAAIPEESFELARAGAGFGDVYLSPLHGALIAGMLANRGQWRWPVLYEGESGEVERVLGEDLANALNDMLERTITEGTARRTFRERGFRVEKAVGKTGHLADRNPYRDYSWFVGFAPKDEPKVAVGAVVVNDAAWRIRATWLGREAMRLALARR